MKSPAGSRVRQTIRFRIKRDSRSPRHFPLDPDRDEAVEIHEALDPVKLGPELVEKPPAFGFEREGAAIDADRIPLAGARVSVRVLAFKDWQSLPA